MIDFAGNANEAPVTVSATTNTQERPSRARRTHRHTDKQREREGDRQIDKGGHPSQSPATAREAILWKRLCKGWPPLRTCGSTCSD